jgi:tetratricopeptide (TPR) repeat protein
MPFVTQALRSRQHIQPPFVGRTAERRFFSQQVLAPDEPTVHLIGIWGPVGIGSSALLAQWREDAHTGPFKDGCLTALADGRVGSPLEVMRAYAAQFRAAGTPLVAFEELLAYLMTVPLHPSSVEQQAAYTLFAQHVQDLARSRPLRAVPLIGEIYEAESRANRITILQQHPALQLHDNQTFQEWLVTLTHAFFDDLNWLAAQPVSPASKRGRRIILFLDEITAASHELLTWLHSLVLPTPISTQVVLVLAGSDPLDRLLPAEPGITVLPLHPLTEEETRLFLAAYGITDATRVTTLWQHSGGLALALRLLAPVPRAWSSTQEDAITTGLHWIEQQEPGYRYLVRYTALFSRSFSHSDLSVCPMFSTQERIQWSRRLLELPFVQSDAMTGEHIYHPLVQQQVCQHVERSERIAYQQARQAIVQHYQRRLERLKRQHGEHIVREEADHRLTLALLEQWLKLADETSLSQAVELALQLVQQTADHAALTFLLRTLVPTPSENSVPNQSTPMAKLLLAYSEADLRNPATLSALAELLAFVGKQPDFPVPLQARLYGRRAACFLLQEQPQPAREDSIQAVTLDPTYTDGYLLRGIASAALGANSEALTDFDQVISRDAHHVSAYAHRSLIHRAQRAYEQAVEDTNRMLALAPELPEVTLLRNVVYAEMDKARRGLGTFDYRLENAPGDTDAAVLQGMAHCALGQYDQALASFERALALNATHPRIYAGRGHVHLERGDLEHAHTDLARSWELDPHDGTTGLLLAWVRLCRGEPDDQIRVWLERLTASLQEQEPTIALISQGIVLLLQQQFEEALAVFEQVLQLYPQQGEALFWKGLVCALLMQDKEALAALEQTRSAEIPLPTVLFTALRRVASVRPEFYQQQLLPLLQGAEPH